MFCDFVASGIVMTPFTLWRESKKLNAVVSCGKDSEGIAMIL